MSADPAHLARIVAASHAASAAQDELRGAGKEKVKGQRSSPLFPRRPSLLPRSPYSLTDCGDSLAAPPVGLGLRLGAVLLRVQSCGIYLFLQAHILCHFFMSQLFAFQCRLKRLK